MEEKNVKKISLSTFFLILAIIAIIVMGIFIYKLNNDKTTEIQKSTELQSQVNSLNGTVSDLQGKIDSISKTIDSNNSTQNNTTTDTSSINKTAIESTIQKYFNIRQILASDTLNVLVELGLKTTNQTADDYKGFSSDKPYANSYFLITDVSYSDFEKAISKYMTMDLFKSQYPDYVINKDGILCIYSDGGTSGSSTIKECKISKTDSNTYVCNVTITRHADDDGSNTDEKHTITVSEKDGNYIVSSFK